MGLQRRDAADVQDYAESVARFIEFGDPNAIGPLQAPRTRVGMPLDPREANNGAEMELSRGRSMNRVVASIAVALVTMPAVVVGGLALADRPDPQPEPVWRVVQSHCSNGRTQQGIDTGRADGLLLAKDTGVKC